MNHENEIADFYAMGRQLPSGTGRDSSILGEQTEASQGAAKRKGEKRGPYQKAKKEAKKEVNAISKALKSSTKLEQNMKALELLLQYGNEEEKKKADGRMNSCDSPSLAPSTGSVSTSCPPWFTCCADKSPT